MSSKSKTSKTPKTPAATEQHALFLAQKLAGIISSQKNKKGAAEALNRMFKATPHISGKRKTRKQRKRNQRKTRKH